MKTDLSFLPDNKQQELIAITALLRDRCDDIEMVILYGSYARNEYKEAKDLAPDRWSGHVSDYDILVVTGEQETAKNRKLLSEMQNICQEQNFSATVRITLFDLQELNIKLIEGQYFYSDVKKDGIVLFNEKNHVLAKKRELTNTEKARIAQDHFDQWYQSAVEFFEGYELWFERKKDKAVNFKKASFELHQATEACLKCILLVFTNYSPDEHYLTILEMSALEEVPALADIFPKKPRENFLRFDLLDKAYIGARYIRDFFVEKEDIEFLAPLVEKLLSVTKEECEKRIQELAANRA